MDNQNETATTYSISTMTGEHPIAEVKTEYEKQGMIHVYWFVVNGQRISEHRFMDNLGKPSHHLISKYFNEDRIVESVIDLNQPNLRK